MNKEDVLNVIKKRIALIFRINQTMPARIHISEEEYKKLGEIKEVDGVKLEIIKVHKVRKDCIFYNGTDCDAMRELICKTAECKRFNDKITKEEIEESIKNYSIRKSFNQEGERNDL